MKPDKRTMRAKAAPVLLIPAALLLVLFDHCTTSITGGGEIGNPKTIAGKVIDKNNRGVAGMRIRLLASREFNPVAASRADTSKKPFETVHPISEAMTDSLGAYIITVPLNQKSYTVFGTFGNQNMDSSIMIYHPFVPSEGVKDIALIDTAVWPGTAIVGISDSLFKPQEYVFVQGTLLFAKIDAVGRKTLLCPAGFVSFVYYSASRDSVVLTIGEKQSPISIHEGVRTDVSGLVHRISKPNRPVGDTLVNLSQQGNGISYATGNAVSNLGDTLLYKISWGDSSISQWMPAGVSQLVLWRSVGTYAVWAQAKSAKDVNVVSPTSDTLRVTVY
jgi:hypothetical protein